MVLLTLCILSAGLIGGSNCSPLPDKESSTLIGNNVVVLCILAAFGTISLVGACALCFRRKKTFEKLENESGAAESIKKNEYPIFRALAADGINESSAIVPGERNNLSRDNLLNSSDNLTTTDESGGGGSVVDSSDVVLIEKTTPSSRDKTQPTTITYETEKDIKKHQSPSSSTPLLFANNVQSYQPITEQIQQKSVTASDLSPYQDFYDEQKQDFMVVNVSEEAKEDTNPFFNSISAATIVEEQSSKEVVKDDTSEVESSVNDNSEKYQILEEETDGEEQKWEEVPPMLQRQGSNGSVGDNNSIEEALRALDIAIGSEDDGEGDEIAVNMEEIKEEATFLVDSIVNDCEKILEAREAVTEDTPKTPADESFEDFSSLGNQNMSTPCAPQRTKIIPTIEIEAAKALFPDGVDISGIDNATFAVDKTFDVEQPPAVDSPPQISDKTFDSPPTIKIDKDENGSEDLTTVTPVNTPIELSYSSETWDKMTCNTSTGAINKTVTLESASDTITFNQDGWYLHPKAKNDTFDICDYEEEEAEAGDMSSTYDQLRKQLTEMLPHAQGMSQHNDFLDEVDDFNKDSSSPSENYGIKYGDLDEATNAGAFELLINQETPAVASNEMHINYKRSLSPILEESECDETCRTFIKLLDSTSTGIMESASAEAQMGQIPKALMASNDTLFNFEDTLSDQTDLLMSPRLQTGGSSGSSTLSRAESEITPTNEDQPVLAAIDNIMRNSIRQHPLNLDLAGPLPSTSKYEVTKLALEDGSWPLDLPEAQQIINDLSSPEQNKTADSLSFEQDVTYTIDDQKTCVSFVLKNDDERISEISEPLFASESLDLEDDRNSLLNDDVISIEADDNFNFEMNDENGNQDCDTKEMELTLNVHEMGSTVFDNDSINPDGDETLKKEFEVDSLEPESKILLEDNDTDSIPTSQGATAKSVYSNDSMDNTVQSEDKSSASDSPVKASAEVKGNDSSDESEGSDKKKGSSTDIRQVSCNQGMMTTSFTKEWSDDDSSHSSEEFMYVKGGVEKAESKLDEEGEKQEEEEKIDDQKTTNDKETENIEMIDIDLSDAAGSWKMKQDQIPATPIFHGDEPQIVNESEDESAEEGEFIPSCWDHSLQPKRSSLKSPEKEKSVEKPKKSRHVAFKIQRYHSVYEYPCEVVQLSPAFSEPQLWSNYMDDYSGNIDYFTYAHQLSDVASNFPQQIDGFNISSSSRPFHSANVAQLHNTWPNDSTDFSWSQIQDENETEETSKQLHFPLKIEWPARKNFDEEDSDERPDSGVGESSDQLTDSPSMGELCHTKSTLRLPLELVSSTSSEVSDFMSDHGITKEQEAVTIEITNDDESPKQPKSLLDDDESDKMILPTPSCTGSMDSLSSNSGSSSSERGPPSFTTFGKENVTKESEISGRTSIIFIEDDVEATDIQGDKKKETDEKYILSNKLTLTIGSSDEDSGFENISRMAIK